MGLYAVFTDVLVAINYNHNYNRYYFREYNNAEVDSHSYNHIGEWYNKSITVHVNRNS